MDAQTEAIRQGQEGSRRSETKTGSRLAKFRPQQVLVFHQEVRFVKESRQQLSVSVIKTNENFSV